MDRSTFVAQLHHSQLRTVVACTGGGSGAIAALLEEPGASRTVLEGLVPYSAESLAALLGARPEQFCSSRTARMLAMSAFERARRWHVHDTASPCALVGVGCTASLVSDRPKQGSHRVHVAWQTLEQTVSLSATLVKGSRTRREEEAITTRLVLNALAEAGGLTERLPTGLDDDEPLDVQRQLAPPEWQALLAGTRSVVAYDHGQLVDAAAAPRVVFPGAFDPLHAGHRAMAAFAERRLGEPVTFELSIENVDKPLLDYQELARRQPQFADGRVCFTRAPTFVRKAALFPGATFLVGADTIVRIGEPRYYHDQPTLRDAALEDLARHDARFLVFGRRRGAAFETLDDLPLPASLRRLCTGVEATDFRQDLSSTELRRGVNDA